MPDFATGDVFVNHRIEGVAGRGGMGVVYRAMQIGLERIVALKVLAPALAEDPGFRERFVAESKIAASIEHPNVIPLYYAGERDGVLFIVMRYVDGPDLRALIRASGRLKPERAARIVAQVGSALDAAHARGLVHRDVKPANVLTTPVTLAGGRADDHVYLTDFGLSKRAASVSELSRAGGWVGTLGYVPPEQIRGERLDARADIYALGCVLFHALTGAPPFLRDSDEATLLASLNDPFPTQEVPTPFAEVLGRALAKDPGDRHTSAGELGQAALAAARETTASAARTGWGRSAFAATPDDAETRPSPEPVPWSPAPSVAQVPAPYQITAQTPAPYQTAAIPPPRPAPPAAGAAGGAWGDRARAPIGAAAILLVAALAVVAVLLVTGGDPATPDRPGSGPPSPVADPPLYIGRRPNALTIASGAVWVVSRGSSFLSLVNARTGRRIPDPVDIGEGATSIASGFGEIWVVKASTGALLRIDARSRRRVGPAIDLDTPGQAVAVDTGDDAVWVGVRNSDRAYRGPETVVRVDRSTGALTRIEVPGGVQDLAVGEGAVWITNRFGSSVVRIKTSNLSQSSIPVGRSPRGIAVGEAAVWVANEGDDTVTRIRASTLRTQTIDVPDTPTRVAVGGGFVWVTAQAAGRVIRIVPQRRRVRDAVETGRRPFAVDVLPGSVWLTLLGDDAVQRVPFEPESRPAGARP